MMLNLGESPQFNLNEVSNHLDFFRLDQNNMRRAIPYEEKERLHTLALAYKEFLYPNKTLSDNDWREIGETIINLRPKLGYHFDLQASTAILATEFQIENIPQNQPIAACEDIAELEITPDYSPAKIYINTNHFLTRKLPYWVIKTLFAIKLIQQTNIGFKIADLTQLPFHSQIEDRLPISPLCEYYINFELEEAKIQQIYRLSEQLTTTYEQLTYRIHDINITKANLLQQSFLSENDAESVAIQKYIEEFENYEKLIQIPYASDLKVVNTHLTEDRSTMKQSLLSELETLKSEVFEPSPIILEGDHLISILEKEKLAKNTLLKIIIEKFDPLLGKIKKIINANEKKAQTQIFLGKMFPLYAFDINNLHNSLRQRYRIQGQRYKGSIAARIRDYFLPPSENFKAFLFASKHLEKYRSDLPENENVIWSIEEKIKRKDPNGMVVYCDVDTNLTAIIYNFIEKHHKQISAFYLGSGDKDLMIVGELAKKYQIPFSVIVVEAKNLSHDLRKLADEIYELF
jgi:hypothetical protein